MPLYEPRHNVAMLELHVAKFATRTGNDVKVRHAYWRTQEVYNTSQFSSANKLMNKILKMKF